MSKAIFIAVIFASLGNATRMSLPGYEGGKSLSISSTGSSELLNVSNISQPSHVTRATQSSLLNVSRTLQRVYAREVFSSHQTEDGQEPVGDDPFPTNGQNDSRPPPKGEVTRVLTTIEGTKGRRYTYLKELSQGGQGVVWSAVVTHRRSTTSPIIDLKTEPNVAIKVSLNRKAALSAKAKGYLWNEVKFMERLKKCGHVVGILDYFQDAAGFYYVVMEHMAGGDLLDSVVSAKGYNETQTHKVFVDLLDGLECMHKHHIAHLDIKLENVLLDKTGAAKLGDLGLSLPTPFQESILRGTQGYLAPEMFTRSAFDGTKVDVFALGVLLFGMVTNFPPFDRDDFSGVHSSRWGYTKYVKQDLLTAGVSRGLIEVISCMLRQDKTARCSIARIKGKTWFKR